MDPVQSFVDLVNQSDPSTPQQTSGENDPVGAFTQLVQNQNVPSSVKNAQGQIGSKDYIDKEGNTYCEQFVENTTGSGWKGTTATNAWNNYNQSGQAVADPSLSGVKPGDVIYFTGANEPDGHTGIYEGDGKFIGAAEDGVQEHSIQGWMDQWGQQPVGYVPQGGNYGTN